MASVKSNARKAIALSRDLPEVAEGIAAYKKDPLNSECPYPTSVASMKKQRMAWFTGWYDEKHRTELGHIWEKYNISYP